MPLTKCVDCEYPISRQASRCPRCGSTAPHGFWAPVRHLLFLVALAVLAIGGLVVLGLLI